MPTDLKQHRARLLGNLTRIRRSAFVIIDTRGSRTQLTSLMLELDKALQAIENVTDEYVNILESRSRQTASREVLRRCGKSTSGSSPTHRTLPTRETGRPRISSNCVTKVDKLYSFASGPDKCSTEAIGSSTAGNEGWDKRSRSKSFNVSAGFKRPEMLRRQLS